MITSGENTGMISKKENTEDKKMLYTIESKKVKVEISDLGGELMSIQTKADGCEYLWQGDPKYWAGRACVLFPICGRLVDGYYTYEGNKYEMELHGFIRRRVLTVAEQKADSITFEFRADEESKKIYPFDFTFRITYTIDGNKLLNSFTVVNHGDGVLPYAVGGHPGFNVPLDKNDKFEDCYLSFGEKCQPEMFLLSPTCFLNGDTAPFALKCGTRRALTHDMFDDDAIFLKNMAKSVSIKSKNSKKSVTVEYPDFDYVGFWHARNSDAPFVCIEPWTGLPGTDGKVDDFATKQAMKYLDGGKSATYEFTVTVK